ncbi:MAG: manganese efflux pump, partial [Defluviitaleaceae bacterium]|nr:manganese efflux pump [Defluviitaleaceae bacterium]
MISIEIVVIAFGLAMDAFAVAASYSMGARTRALRTALIFGAFFGAFQFVMPLVGYLLHMILPAAVLGYSDVIAFALLFIIGARMVFGYIRDWLKPSGTEDSYPDKPVSLRELMALSFATSIDALAAGTSLALVDVNILA